VAIRSPERPEAGAGSRAASNAKVITALSFLTLIAFILFGRLTHPGDAAGIATGGVRDFLSAAGRRACR
jgi:hypothetical protein